jgi:hypothetical protein
MIISIFTQARAGQAFGIIAMLIHWRFIVRLSWLTDLPAILSMQVGLEVGGDRPHSATLSSDCFFINEDPRPNDDYSLRCAGMGQLS